MNSEAKTDAFEKFQRFAAGIVSVPKPELDRREEEYRKQREEEKRRKK